MQSLKYLIMIAACSTAGALQAAPTTDLPPAPKPGSQSVAVASPPSASQSVAVTMPQSTEAALPGAVKSAETTMQEYIQQLVEQDYAHQAELRKLSNQVEIEKKLNEIRKLRGEDKNKPAAPVVSKEPQTAAANDNDPSVSTGPLPHVVLESVIGGLSRVAIVNNSGDKLLYVKPGDSFAMDGKNYLLVRDAKLGLLIKDATQ